MEADDDGDSVIKVGVVKFTIFVACPPPLHAVKPEKSITRSAAPNTR